MHWGCQECKGLHTSYARPGCTAAETGFHASWKGRDGLAPIGRILLIRTNPESRPLVDFDVGPVDSFHAKGLLQVLISSLGVPFYIR